MQRFRVLYCLNRYLESLMSSAYKSIQDEFTTSTISFMNNRNSNGPRF
jgi:hypothetical protein